METCSPEDSALVNQCLAGDRKAWGDLFTRYERLIRLRIRAVLCSMGYSPREEDYIGAYNKVVDRIFVSKGLKNFRHQGSLTAFIKTLTANATIDWIRGNTTKKGRMDSNLSTVNKKLTSFEKPGTLLDEETDDGKYLGGAKNFDAEQFEDNESFSVRLPVSGELLVFVKILLLRYFEMSERDFAVMQQMAKDRSPGELRKQFSELEKKVTERAPSTEEKFHECSFAFTAAMIFEDRKGDRSSKAFERAVARRDHLLAEYRARGFEDFPSRTEISELLGWDINKVDRMKGKLKEALSPVIDKKVRNVS